MHFSMLEKIGASVLLCAWLVYGANFLGDTLVHVREHHAAGATSEHAATPAAAAAPAATTAPVDIKTLLASADAEAGAKVFGKCKSCHTVEKGGKNGVGPNLWNVVGGPKAHMDGFAYSAGLAGMHSDVWSYVNLNAFLESPKDYVANTKMSFAGLKKPEERANVIAYLRSMSDQPAPLP